MAKFIDHHLMPEMSAEQLKAMMAQIKSAIDSKRADKFGVTQLNSFIAPDEARGYTDAPNPEAVVKSHAALGIKLDIKDAKKVLPVA